MAARNLTPTYNSNESEVDRPLEEFSISQSRPAGGTHCFNVLIEPIKILNRCTDR